MARKVLKLIPGVDTVKTPNLNEAALSTTNLIRFMPDRTNLGLVQKLGGWVAYYNSPLTSTIRALKGYADLNAVNHLAIGAESELALLTSGSLQDITPRTLTDNVTVNFSTTIGSYTVTVVDAGYSPSVLDYVEFVTPVSVGGIVLFGPYSITPVSPTSYSVQSATAATSTVASGGAVETFQTFSGSQFVTVTLNNHGYVVGDEHYVSVSTAIGGVTLFGLYQVLSVPTANTFTISAGYAATSNAGPTAINSGQLRANYYVGVSPQAVGTGFGVGGFGIGGFGVGTVSTTTQGTPITATDWTLDNFGQNLIACPAGGAIYNYVPNYTTQNAVLVSAQAPLVNDGIFVAMPERQVVAWGSSFTLQKDPLLIRWSDAGDSTVWIATATNQAGSYRIPSGSKIVTCLQGPQQALIWTDLDLWAMQYVGPPLVYGFNKIGSNCGGIGRHSAGQLMNVVYWMSQKNFFMNRGNGPETIPCPVWDNVFQDLKSGNDANGNPYTDRIRCGINSQFNEVVWYYPSANGTGENDSYVKYQVNLNQWDYGSLGRTAWIDQSVLGPPIGSGTDNYLYQHEIGNDAANGLQTVAMASTAETGYFEIADADNIMFVDQVWPDMKWGQLSEPQNATVNMTFYGTNYPGDTPTVYGPYAVTQQTEYFTTRIRARLLAISVSSNDVGTFWRLGGIRYRAAPDGKY